MKLWKFDNYEEYFETITVEYNYDKKINRIMQLFYVFRISCLRKSKMIWLDLFKELFFR